jgi:glutathione S-transferase
MTDCFRLIEDTLLAGPWVMGETYSIADPYLFTMSAWLDSDGVDIAAFPKVDAHYQAMLQRPAVARALAGEKAG